LVSNSKQGVGSMMNQEIGEIKLYSPIASSSKLKQAREERLRIRQQQQLLSTSSDKINPANKSVLEDYDDNPLFAPAASFSSSQRATNDAELNKPTRRILSFDQSATSSANATEADTAHAGTHHEIDVKWKQYVICKFFCWK